MELVIAILVAGPLGYFARTAQQGLTRYLLLAVAVFPLQTLLVHLDSPEDINPGYFAFNAVILVGGVTLNRVGHLMGRRRRSGSQQSRKARPAS